LDETGQRGYVVGVDLGDSYVNAACVAPDGQIVARSAAIRVDCARGAPDILRDCVAPAIAQAVAGSPAPVATVGIAMPGTLRPEEGLCVLSPPLGWENVSVRNLLASSVPIVLVNDIRARIVAEMHYGDGVDTANFVCVTLGRSIQGGLVIDGRIYEGDSDSAGEIGHITVDHDGLSCTCGNQGCLETVASGPGVSRMAAESLRLGAQSVLSDWVSDEVPITAELVYRAAREGDALATKVWEKVGRYLGLGLAAVITIVNPQRIILEGKVSQAFEFFAPSMTEEIRRRARMVPRDYTAIVQSRIGLDAPMLGAAWHAFEALRAARVEA
jgi:glucokinase